MLHVTKSTSPAEFVFAVDGDCSIRYSTKCFKQTIKENGKEKRHNHSITQTSSRGPFFFLFLWRISRDILINSQQTPQSLTATRATLTAPQSPTSQSPSHLFPGQQSAAGRRRLTLTATNCTCGNILQHTARNMI